IAAALRPLVDRLEARRIGRGVALAVVYVAVLAAFSLVVCLAAPRVLADVAVVAELGPAAYERLRAAVASGVGAHAGAAAGSASVGAAAARRLLAALPS